MTKQQAITQYARAIQIGDLVPAKSCVLCDAEENGGRIRNIRGHHWKGYDFPFDVWWVCRKCNYRLIGKHDGSLQTVEEARTYISSVTPKGRVSFSLPAKLRPDTIIAIREIAAQKQCSITTLGSAWIEAAIDAELSRSQALEVFFADPRTPEQIAQDDFTAQVLDTQESDRPC